MALVHDVLPSLAAGRHVLSTVRLRDWTAPCRACDANPCTCGVWDLPDHPLYIKFEDFRQLMELEHADILMDEVTGIASSRESQSLPVQVANFLHQLRRKDVTLAYTAVGWARSDKVIREATQAVTVCRGFLPKDRPGADRVWRDNRLFRWATYDAADFEEWTTSKRERLRKTVGAWVWREGLTAQYAYDTLDAVAALGWADQAGMCMVCGGRRATPKCSCKGDSRDSMAI